MSILSAALHKAMIASWDAQLDWEFKKYWSQSDREDFLALEDQEAAADQPFPFCIFEQFEGSTLERSTGPTSNEGRQETHELPWQFRVYARTHDAGGDTAKDIAAHLAAEITKRYGGHPTVKPKTMLLDQGGVLLVQYDTDFGMRQGEEEHMWQVNYNVRLDVPMAA